MKIDGIKNLSINVISTKELGNIFKNLNVGDTISAFILKNEGNRAALEIGGKTITAEFTNGVPNKNNIDLILTSKTTERIQFSLIESKGSDYIFKLLSNFSILHENDIKTSLQNLAKFINSANVSFIDINLLLMGIKKEKEKERDLPALLNRLLQKGVTFQTLLNLNYLIYSRLNPLLFFSYQYMLSLTGKKASDFNESFNDNFKESIEDLLKVIQEDDSDFESMFKIFFDQNIDSKIYGKSAFPENETFTDIEYLIGEKSVFLKLNFSVIGTLEVLIQNRKGAVSIHFLSEKDNLIDFMKENDNILKNMLNQNDIKKYNIAYYNSKKIVDKLKIWSLDFYTKSEFNVKA
ncbi:MAG: hypothetical protein FWF73_06685 [Spirochaetes bacterium]|nr:hypothetical protein [Spirochaetota bacterium]